MKMELLQGKGHRSASGSLPPVSMATREAREMGLAGWMWEMWATLRTNYRRSQIQPVHQMQIIETLGLGGRRQLSLIRCGAERFLVGCGPDQVHAILRVSTPETSETFTPAKDA